MFLETARLRLEPFADRHFDGLCRLNGDARVMRYITGRAQSPDEVRGTIARVGETWATLGHSWWAFVDKAGGELVGAGCVQHIERNRDNPLELGWRLLPQRWGQGLASEAARGMAAFAFDSLGTPFLLANAMPENISSRRVMERLGMRFRGIEHWWQMDLATYVLTMAEWRGGHAGV